MEWCYQEEQYRDGINFNLQTGSIMDLGIQGKNALLAASTSGLGLACPMAQAREGCIVYINGREAERLEKAQQHISQATGVQASLVQAGINTSAMVKSPRAAMSLSTTARNGLTAFSKAISFEAAADNVTLNNLLPERIDNPRQAFMAQKMVKDQGIDLAEARRRIAQTVAAKRFGTPQEFADACAFLCSAQAGFISGQNLQLDGGSYPGLI